MAIETAGLDLSVVVANADLSASQFCGVKIATADFGVSLASTGGEAILGILQNKPLATQAADVRFVGVSKAKAGASYSRGALLMTDTSGRFITATATNHAVAMALEAAAAANEIRTVLILGGPGDVQ
jgi:hypothetical protein